MLKQEVADKLSELLTPANGNRILEIGTGWGESTEFFSNLKPDWKIYTIDGFGLFGDGRIYKTLDHETVLKLSQKIQRFGNVIQILADSATVPWELPIDVLFIDGDHTFEGCKNDFVHFSPWVNKGGLIIFDDYTQDNNPNNGVRKVVEYALEPKDGYVEMVYEGYYCAILKRL